MKLVFYNMAYGTGMNGSWKRYLKETWRFFWLPLEVLRNIAKTMKEADPDVLCLAEVDNGSFRNRFRSQSKQLSRMLKLSHAYTQTKYHPKSIWQYMHLIRKQHDAILSRHKGQIKRHNLKSGMKKLVQEFIVDGYSVFTVHLAVLSKRVRRKQLKELTEIIKECPRPHILCGDFNISTGLDEITDFLKKTKLKLAFREPSFPSIKPIWYLDLFLVSPDVKIEDAGTIPVLHSDHLPVWVEVSKK